MGSLSKIVAEVLSSVRRVAAYLAMLVWSCLLLVAPAHAQTVARYTTATTGTVSDTATPCSNPLKRTFTVGSSQTVTDVNIGVLMAHTYRGDLVITLVSPAGTRVAVVNRVGGGGITSTPCSMTRRAAQFRDTPPTIRSPQSPL